jgi:hypothetical protein
VRVCVQISAVESEGPRVFLQRLKESTDIDAKPLRFCYDRLKSLLYAAPRGHSVRVRVCTHERMRPLVSSWEARHNGTRVAAGEAARACALLLRGALSDAAMRAAALGPSLCCAASRWR